MASDKLNRSLDDILSERRKSTRRSRPVRRVAANGSSKPATTAPVGGVKKNVKGAKPEKVAVPTGPSGSGEGKIIVSNLPFDVTETQIKDYFHKSIGHVKKVLLTYGPNGQSRGIATIIFSKPAHATEAAKQLDGIKVDNRPMKVEVILDAKHAPAPAAPKSLSDRMSQPKPAAKAQPKPVTATKPTKGANKTRGKPRRGRNAGRAKPKTAEELDAEMVDYFDTTAAPADEAMGNGGAVQPAANGAMEEEIL